MKKILLTLLACLFVIPTLSAQETPAPEKHYRLRKKYINVGFSNLNLTPGSGMFETDQKLKSNYGASFTTGRTYFVHKKPIAGMIRFGIDATWFDLNYTNYKLQYIEGASTKGASEWEKEYYDGYEETVQLHQADIAVQVGPSITINPIANLNIHAYFRYAPSFSLIMGDGFLGNYATYFVTGGTVSYGVIGLGVEYRFGNCNYKLFGGGWDEESDGRPTSFKSKLSGARFYVSFRF